MKAFNDVFRSLGQVFVAPRVLLTVWLAVLVPALFVVAPLWSSWDAALSHQPASSFTLNQSLDVDLMREQPGFALRLAGAAAFVLIAMAFLAGGILARVGVGPVRERYRLFWSDCGRHFLRNLRVLGLGVVFALLLGWGIDALRGVLDRGTQDVDPGATLVPLWLFDLRWSHLFEAGGYLAGFAFLLLVFTSKVAMARLAVLNKRSAVVAWSSALGRVLRQPLRSILALTLLTVAWIGGAHALGMGTAHFLEVQENLWLGLLFGQLGALWGATIVVATLLTARRFIAQVPVAPVDEKAPKAETVVEIPRVSAPPKKAPADAPKPKPVPAAKPTATATAESGAAADK